MVNKETLSWSVEVPASDYGDYDPFIITRAQARDSVARAKQQTIGSTSDLYKLDDDTTEAMWQRVMQSAIIMTPSTREVIASNNIVIDNVVPSGVALGGLRLVAESANTAAVEPEAPNIRLVIPAIGGEYRRLKKTVERYVGVTKDNPDAISGGGSDRIQELIETPKLMENVAIELAASRRILKYGLLPDEALPEGMREHGFESWRKVVNNNVSAADRKKQNSQTLRGLYVENDQAMKNLRGNVWPIISSRIIGIDPTKDVMFNVVHGSVSNESPDSYLISFRNKLTSEVSPVEGKEMITSIYSPRRTIRRVK